MDLLQEYKDLYYKEIEYYDRLNNKITTSITFLTILGSGQILLWSQFVGISFKWYTILYFILCVISTLLFLICMYKFYRAYSGYQVNYFPIKDMAITIHQIQKIAQSLDDKYKAENYINDMFCERFINDAIHNRNINIQKNKKHKRLSYFICITFILTIITYATYICIDYYEAKTEDNIQKVYIEGVNTDGQ